METSDRLDMTKATPAIAYDTRKGEYIVIKAQKQKIDFMGGFTAKMSVSIPLIIFCGLSLFGCLLSLCFYLSQAVEDAEKEALEKPREIRGELAFLNNSQHTLPANFGMESTKADKLKEVLRQYKDEADLEENY